MKNLLYILVLLAFFSSCIKKSKLDVINEDSKQQSELLEAYCLVDSLIKHGIINQVAYSAFMEKTLFFYQEFPEESITPKMLWSAGIAGMVYAKYAKDASDDSLIVVNYAQKSIKFFDIILKVYPDYENARNTYLYRGTIYEDILEDYESAKYEYLEYINKYPDDSVSHSLKEYIKYLGITPDEIYRNFTISE